MAFATSPRLRNIVIQGNRIMEESAVRSVLSLKKGSRYQLKKVKTDVQSIFRTSWFDDVEAHLDKCRKNRCTLTYIVKEKPLVEEVTYQGHFAFSTKKLDEIFPFSTYDFLDYKKVQKAIKDLYLEYEKKGYYLAKITHSIQKTAHPGKVKLLIKIQENKKVRINKIRFIGNRFISTKELKQFMGTKEAGLFSFISSAGSYSRDILEQDLNNIRYIYLDRGYWKAHVDSPKILISPDRKHISITISIHEGSAYRAGVVRFAGDLIFSDAVLKESLEISESEIFSYGKLQRDIQRIQRKYGDKGYAFVNVMPKFFIPPEDEDKIIHILFEIQKGREVNIRRMNIFGNHYTRDRVIRREVRLFEGELYNETNKELSIANIRRLGFFDEVQILPKTIKGRDNLVDMEVRVKEREHTGSLDISGGYNDYFGVTGKVKLQKVNVFGTGREVSVDTTLSTTNQNINFSFSDPYFLESRWYLGGNFYLNRWSNQKNQQNIFKVCDQYESEKAKVGALAENIKFWQGKCWASLPGLWHRGFSEQIVSGGITFGRSITDTLKLLLYYRLENITLFHSIDPVLFPVEQASGIRNPVEAIIDYDGRNDRLLPTSGVYSRTSVMHDGLLGRFNYLSVSANVRAYQKLFWNLVFRMNAQYSRHIGLGGAEEDVPFDRLFRLGGINSLRGFDFFSIGPRKKSQVLLDRAQRYMHPNPNAIADRVVGGHEQLYVNWEIQVPLFPKVKAYGVAFVDMGAAYDEISSMDWRSNWGIGLRVFTPMGPVRFEVGFPFSPRLDRGEISRFHFTIGSPF